MKRKPKNQTRGHAPLASEHPLSGNVLDKVMPSNPTARTGVYIAGVVIILIVGKSLLQDLGIFKSKEQVEQEKRDAEISKTSLQSLRNAYKPTLANEQLYSNAANVLYTALGRYSWIDDNPALAVSTIKTYIRNPLDFGLVQFYYGLRQNYNFGIPAGSPSNLVTLLTTQLSGSKLDDVKGYLLSVGVTI